MQGDWGTLRKRGIGLFDYCAYLILFLTAPRRLERLPMGGWETVGGGAKAQEKFLELKTIPQRFEESIAKCGFITSRF